MFCYFLKNDVRFVFTTPPPPLLLYEDSCLIYLICVCLHIVMSNTYFVVFLVCSSSSCVPNVASFSGLSIFDRTFGIRYRLMKKKLYILGTCKYSQRCIPPVSFPIAFFSYKHYEDHCDDYNDNHSTTYRNIDNNPWEGVAMFI
jgi:hypothetical protein